MEAQSNPNNNFTEKSGSGGGVQIIIMCDLPVYRRTAASVTI